MKNLTIDTEPELLTPEQARELYRDAAAHLRAAAEKLNRLRDGTYDPTEPEHPDYRDRSLIIADVLPKTESYVMATAWAEPFEEDTIEELESAAEHLEKAATATNASLLAEWREQLPGAIAGGCIAKLPEVRSDNPLQTRADVAERMLRVYAVA